MLVWGTIISEKFSACSDYRLLIRLMFWLNHEKDLFTSIIFLEGKNIPLYSYESFP